MRLASPRCCASFYRRFLAFRWVTALVVFAALSVGCTCLRPAPADSSADADRDGIPDRRDCIVGKAAEIRAGAGLKLVTLVDGKLAENCPDTRRHRLAIATLAADGTRQPLAEFNYDHRSCPLVLRELTIERQGDLFSDGFLVVNGLTARRKKVVEFKVQLTEQSRPSATPALCLRDLGAEITSTCAGPGERLLRCAPSGSRRLEPPYCVLDSGGKGATVAYISGSSDDLADGKSVSDGCDASVSACLKPILNCQDDSDEDGVKDCDDCRPFDKKAQSTHATDIACNNVDENCDCDPTSCLAQFQDCLKSLENPLFVEPGDGGVGLERFPRTIQDCRLQQFICRISCGDPPHSCNDGNECTEDGRCENGPCTFTAKDGATCTTPVVIPECKVGDLGTGACRGDKCQAVKDASNNSSCDHPMPTQAACVDKTKWSCQVGKCVYGESTSGGCDDGNRQTVNDRCGPGGVCSGDLVGSSCNDNRACTANETWNDFGECRGTPTGACQETPPGCQAGFQVTGRAGCGTSDELICSTQGGVDFCNFAQQTVGGRSCGHGNGFPCATSSECVPWMECRKDSGSDPASQGVCPAEKCCRTKKGATSVACWFPPS